MSDPTEDDPLEYLARELVAGNIHITNIRIRVCGKCKEGTLVSDPLPNWMNRWKCNLCGKAVSR